jgi:hypothetical protein
MTEMRHLRCDRCTDDILIRTGSAFSSKHGWARCQVGVKFFDLCPNCWAVAIKPEAVVTKQNRRKSK